MKTNRFIKFFRGKLLIVLAVSLVFIISCPGYAQKEISSSVIRQAGTSAYKIDPAIGTDQVSSQSYVNLYDSLVFPNLDGSVKPWLAKSWEISGDSLTYTFELVPGVKFHNGDELTAEDVVFSLDRIKTIGEGYGYLFITNVKEAKALEKYKVEFTLNQRYGPFLGSMVRLYITNKKQVMANLNKEGSYGEYGDYGKEWLVTHDAGSGPYKVKENKVPEYLLLEKYDEYWAGWDNKDAPQYWKQLGTREATLVKTLFSRGELELSDKNQSYDNFVLIDRMPNIDLSAHYVGLIMNIMLNTKKAPTDDIHFRKALAYCMDYDQIIDKIFIGAKRAIGPVASCTPGFNPNLKPYTFDLKKAEEELKKSPYYEKLDQYPVDLQWLQTYPDQEKIVLMFQAYAATLGIKVKPIKLPWITLTSNMAQPETTPHGSIVNVSPAYAEAGSMLEQRYHSNSCGTWEQGEWLQNSEIDAMIEDSIATLDREERFKKYYAVQEKILELCPTIYLGESTERRAYRSDYVVYPAAELIKQGKSASQIVGYNLYLRDFKVFPEKAQPPYVPFQP